MVHVGIDVHLRESQICVLREDGTLTQQRVATRPDRLVAVVGPLAPAQVLVEASGQSEWVAATLEGVPGLTVVVADPNYAPMYPGRRRIKTDQRDAEALAIASAKGTYRAVHRRSAAQRQVQARLTVREQVVRVRTQLINVVRATLRRDGVRLPSGPADTLPARVAAADVPLAAAVVVAPLLALLRQITAQLQALDADLAADARQDAVVQRLMGVPGVGPLTALAFVATVDTPTRFARAGQGGELPGARPRGAQFRSPAAPRRDHQTRPAPRALAARPGGVVCLAEWAAGGGGVTGLGRAPRGAPGPAHRPGRARAPARDDLVCDVAGWDALRRAPGAAGLAA